ncbi:conserved hypothetical protein [Pyrobaculum islandicum DSM 4184]|uniref:Thioredoxin domain-containing protein n=1 Tax=Pyrobaculum islandicum (strain DSM 4184 / JCM 9189 / GEO3) TaxID=384616 RepID=A1RRT9_PYRIL|nr:DsbA family protein [Pyrobaculum islandicum]ABL87671.1 conserved hypothetical protein [Pyrobaculum islandicum DSM 4184]
MRPRTLFITAIVVFLIIAATIIYKNLSTSTSQTAVSSALPIPSWAISFGNPNAPLVLVELFDLHCPYCAIAHEKLDPLYRRLMLEGKLRLIFVDFIVHPDAVVAHRYLHCAYKQLGNKTYDLLTQLYTTYLNEGPEKQLELLRQYQCSNAPTQNDFEDVKRAMVNFLIQKGLVQIGTPTFIIVRNGSIDIVVGADVNRVSSLLSQ